MNENLGAELKALAARVEAEGVDVEYYVDEGDHDCYDWVSSLGYVVSTMHFKGTETNPELLFACVYKHGIQQLVADTRTMKVEALTNTLYGLYAARREPYPYETWEDLTYEWEATKQAFYDSFKNILNRGQK